MLRVVLKLAILVVITTATTLLAVVNGIKITPSTVVVGQSYTLSADLTNNADMVKSFEWELSSFFPHNCHTAPRVVASAESTGNLYAETPGKYQYKLTTTYKAFPGKTAPAPTIHTKDLLVLDPNNVVITNGAYLPFPVNSSTQLVYQIRHNSTNCGPYMVGTVQEKRTNMFFRGQRMIDDSLFGPDSASPTFRLSASQIWDEHFLSIDPWTWTFFLNNGDEVWSGDQALRISVSDPCDNVYFIPLGKKHFVHRKISDTEVQVEITDL